MELAYRLGVDIGGTFTDATLWDDRTGEAHIAKVSTTPRDPSQGFMHAVEQILAQAGLSAADIPLIVHGTTVATNAIIEGNTARTAFVTTRGFRDMLEIQRQIRPSLYDLQFEKPRPLVPRDLAFEVSERLDARGAVVTALDEDDVRSIAAAIERAGVASVAVCFLHSYANAQHEHRVGALLRALIPELSITCSADLAPEFREYYRASTTVVNAAIQPVVKRYLAAIESALAGRGFGGEFLVMQSNGGVMTGAGAGERPVYLVESGPAAGVIAATFLGGELGLQNVISFDMGGTTAKTGLVRDGRPTVTKDYEVGTRATPGFGSSRGSGYPIRTPVIDLVEIGAGGGSIAWVDPGGVLRVGPRSAGADPGPAAYGRGGIEPTVTDANLVLGRINPHNFLGGAVQLHVEAAHAAIAERCAIPLGMDVVDAAHGIIEIANAAMTNAIRLVSIQRGYDPRDFALIAFGGAGPLHANRLAAELQVPMTIIPMSPGITCAMGLLATDLTHEYVRTIRRRTTDIDLVALNAAFDAMEAEGAAALARDGVPAERIGFRRLLEMRYVGQGYELSVDVPTGEVTTTTLLGSTQVFHAAHEQAYGFAVPAEPTEIVTVRVTAVGEMQRPRLRAVPPRNGMPIPAGATRPVYFAEAGGFTETRVFERRHLRAGEQLVGPVIVEEPDSTTVIHPGYLADVDRFGNLVLRSGGAVGQPTSAPALISAVAAEEDAWIRKP